MKKLNDGTGKRCLIAVALLTILGGCAVVPYDSGYYNQPGYAEPAVYVSPIVNFGFYGGSRGYYGGHYRGHHRGYDGHGRGHYGRHGGR